MKFPAEISGKPAVYRRFAVTVNHSVNRRSTDGFRPVRTTWDIFIDGTNDVDTFLVCINQNSVDRYPDNIYHMVHVEASDNMIVFVPRMSNRRGNPYPMRKQKEPITIIAQIGHHRHILTIFSFWVILSAMLFARMIFVKT